MISTLRHISIRNTNPFCNCGLSFNPYTGMPYHTPRNSLTNRCTTDTISSMSSLTLAVIIQTVPTAKRHVTFKKRSNVIQQPTKYRSFCISVHLRTNPIMGALRSHKRCKTPEREHFMDVFMSLCLLQEPCMYLTRGLEDHCWADTCSSTAKCSTVRMFHHQNTLRAPTQKFVWEKYMEVAEQI